MSHRNVTLLLPGFGVNGSLGQDEALALFVFSEDLDRQPWQAQLAHVLGIETEGGAYLPGASLGLLEIDAASLPAKVIGQDVVRADPISLKADRDSATLLSPDQLDLSDDDAAILIEALNAFVAEDGLTFFTRGPKEWYLSGWSAESLKSYPPSFLANRKASAFLPEGEGSAHWRRLMTEIQMLLHTHPVNQQREQRGLMPINSVWFWGGAPLPQRQDEQQDIRVFSDELQAQSLARQLGITHRPLTEAVLADQNAGKVVIDLSLIKAWLNDDGQQLDSELARIAQQWLQPLSFQVSNGQLEQVQVLTEDGLQGVCNAHTIAAIEKKPDRLMKRLVNFFRR